MLSFYTSY